MLEFVTFGDGPDGRVYLSPGHVAGIVAGGASSSAEPYCYAIVGTERVMLAGHARDVAERIAKARGVGVVP
jgi:hypothetical protein